MFLIFKYIFGVPYSEPTPKEEPPAAYSGEFVGKAMVEMPYEPSPYDKQSLTLEVGLDVKQSNTLAKAIQNLEKSSLKKVGAILDETSEPKKLVC